MRDDDNALKDVDLSAWDVPTPEMSADELADGVIARLEGTDVGAAIPVEPSAASTKKRALIIAGVAAAVLAVVIGGWTIVKGGKHAPSRDGAVIAAKAQSIELAGAHADLDAGADVRWKREGSILHVEQRAGNAAWRVGTDNKLVIDAGASLASVEATGASLRVEVKPMNAADVRIAGALTTTAALVAVVVYEGHVKVHDTVTQQTVIVQPGSTYTVQPTPPVVVDEPVVGVAPVGADQTPEIVAAAGHDIVIHDMAPPTRVRIDMAGLCDTAQPELVVNNVKTSSDQFAFNRGTVKYSVTCRDIPRAVGSITVVRDSLDRPMTPAAQVNEINADGRAYRISYQVMPALEVHGGPGTLHVAHGSVDQTYEARGESVIVPSGDLEASLRTSQLWGADGTSYDFRVWFTPDKMSTVSFQLDTGAPIVSLAPITWGPQIELAGTTLASNVMTVAGVTVPLDRDGRFKLSVPGGGSTLVFTIQALDGGLHYAVARANPTNSVTVAPPGCDAAAEKDKGMESVNIGAHAAALAHFEASLACKADAKVIALAYMSACNSQNDAKARAYYNKLAPAQQSTLLQLCVRNHIDPTVASAPAMCDADALKHKGFDFVQNGQHAAALAQFEASLKCQDDAAVAELAVTAACNAKNATKAKLYLPKLGATQQADMETLCKRNGISLATSTSCDADALKDKGMENVNMGQHAVAFAQFEQSLQCKDDAYVRALAFMAACNAKNVPKATEYYAKLTPAQQTKYKVMCIANHIDPTIPSCDPDALKDKGMENVSNGQHAAALQQFEASLRCREDSQVTALAFMAACNAQNAAKARVYYQKLGAADQTRLKVICVRNNIDPTDGSVSPFDTRTGVKAPATCDADKLKDKGMEAVNQGKHAAALADFEQSLACKDDPYVLSLAFMAACNSQDATKAKLYYGKLTPTQRNKYKVMCDRNNIDAESGTLYTEPTGTGYLEVTCQPEAKVQIDGKDTGLTTPVSGKKLSLPAGKHKLTLVVGDDRFTYPFKIEPGKTVKMSKDLR